MGGHEEENTAGAGKGFTEQMRKRSKKKDEEAQGRRDGRKAEKKKCPLLYRSSGV